MDTRADTSRMKSIQIAQATREALQDCERYLAGGDAWAQHLAASARAALDTGRSTTNAEPLDKNERVHLRFSLAPGAVRDSGFFDPLRDVLRDFLESQVDGADRDYFMKQLLFAVSEVVGRIECDLVATRQLIEEMESDEE